MGLYYLANHQPNAPDQPMFKDHWFTIGDSCLAVIESVEQAKRRNVLIFLHGRFGQSEMWAPLMRKQSAHFRCLGLDLPGFGRSFTVKGRGFSLYEQVQIVSQVLAKFTAKGEKAILVGHDMGGVIAQLCALCEPESLDAVVLLNSADLTRAASGLNTGAFCFHSRSLLRTLFKSSQGIEPSYRQLLTSSWQSRWGRASMAQAFRAWEYTWPGPFERQTWKTRLRSLRIPVLLLWGRNDSLNPPEIAEELMRHLPDADLFEDEDCGHWPYLEKTDWVDYKIREFVFRVEGGRQSVRDDSSALSQKRV